LLIRGFAVSMSPRARSTKTFVLLMLTLFPVLRASSLQRACADACAVDAPITVLLMLLLNCAYVVGKAGFNIHCFVLKLDFFSWSKRIRPRESLS